MKDSERQWLTTLRGKSILFEDTPVSFLGRNGEYDAVGLFADKTEPTPAVNSQAGPYVRFQPITSKGRLGRARIELPLSQVPALIAALQQLLPAEPAGRGQCNRQYDPSETAR